MLRVQVPDAEREDRVRRSDDATPSRSSVAYDSAGPGEYNTAAGMPIRAVFVSETRSCRRDESIGGTRCAQADSTEHAIKMVAMRFM